MKKKIALSMLLFVIILSCISIIYMKISSSPERVLKLLRNIKSYECNVDYKFYNSMGEKEETTKQYFLKEKGNKVVFGDNRIQVYNNEGQVVGGNDKDGELLETSKENYDFYEASFINNLSRYLNDERALSFEYNKEIGKGYYKVSIPLDINNPNLDVGILYINIPDKVPERFVILNKKGEKTFEARYTDFQINPRLDAGLLEIKSN
ncbi:germination lipoprotein GerS-related protein [Clostridium sp. 'White wine YQ']|uniref:germination lipoprotein GerS-related protein n=1 Tax=Clostridium sp. 'White wine YQ' TaxID=3027474 RepID=UPI002365585A|nr:germination lipoprotein GerS-related protein [Clostridium sp. 'White wine YQ']MDD7795664.1 germination lipoprotein GerS-related protein [Clostridium sp. 'White wine YQ']